MVQWLDNYIKLCPCLSIRIAVLSNKLTIVPYTYINFGSYSYNDQRKRRTKQNMYLS